MNLDYLEPIVLSALIGVAAIYTLIKDSDVNHTNNRKLAVLSLFILSIGGAVFTGLFGVQKVTKENQNSTLLRRIDTLSTNQSDTLRINLDSTLKIIGLQNVSLDSVTKTLIKANEIIKIMNKSDSLMMANSE